ncbi:MAG: methyltransferase domain-containing protein [Steroidobacteraceae bacterium]
MTSARRVAFNLVTFIPGVGSLAPVQARLRKRVSAKATSSARYCYAVWMRHLGKAAEHGLNADPRVVAELGPGASLGVGLAALLCGAERYYAFDVVCHAAAAQNRPVFEGLVRLLEARAPIPDIAEVPEVWPPLASYAFPHAVLTPERLARSLAPERLERIRRSLEQLDAPGSMIQYRAPWTDSGLIEDEAVDLVLSQAVFEHIDDLSGAYRTMRRWLRPGGFASHTIDFRSHDSSRRWDGHWGYSDLAWRIIRGRDVWSINRQPCSTHRRLLAENGFRIVGEQLLRAQATLAPRSLAPRFRALTDEDRTVSCAYFLCVKQQTPPHT